MSRLAQLGASSLIIGLALIVFKMIGSAIGKDPSYTDFSIRQMTDPDTLICINGMSEGALRSLMNTIVNAPLFIYFIVAGVLGLAIAGYKDK